MNRRKLLETVSCGFTLKCLNRDATNRSVDIRTCQRLTDIGWVPIKWEDQKPGDKIMACDWHNGHVERFLFWKVSEAPVIGVQIIDGIDAMPVKSNDFCFVFDCESWGVPE